MSELILTTPSPAAAVDLIPEADLKRMSVSDAVNVFLTLRMQEQDLRPGTDTYRHYRVHLVKSLCRAYGKMPLAEVRSGHIRHWLANITTTKCKVASPVTRSQYWKSCRTFFKKAAAERWIDFDPCAPVATPRVPDHEVPVLPVRSVFELFRANINNPATPKMALELFGGVRFTTTAKLQAANVNFADRGIEQPAAIHKTNRRWYRAGLPDVLWSWLALATPETWEMPWKAYRDQKQLAFFRAGLRKTFSRYEVPDPEEKARLAGLRNCLRHAFASYHLAKFKNPALTAYLMTHTGTKVLHRHYEGRATQRDAELFWRIEPEAVRTMTFDDFERWVLHPTPILEPESVALAGMPSFMSGAGDMRAG